MHIENESLKSFFLTQKVLLGNMDNWNLHDFVMAINLPTPATDNPLSSPGVIVCWFITRRTEFKLHDADPLPYKMRVLGHIHP